MDPRVRRISESDLDAVVELVHDLAEYERAPDECHLTVDQLRAALFTDAPALYGHVAESDGAVVGFALWFLNFSTWRGRHGVYLEDLFVRPEHRGKGLGKALLRELARVCVEHGYSPVRVVGAGLERTRHRLLHRARRGPDGRVDGVPAQR